MLVRQPYKLHLLKDVLAHPDFDNTKPTVLYLNDCYESFDESVAIIVNAYLTRRDHNILVLDWSTFRQDDYFEFVIPNMKKVSLILKFGGQRTQYSILRCSCHMNWPNIF